MYVHCIYFYVLLCTVHLIVMCVHVHVHVYAFMSLLLQVISDDITMPRGIAIDYMGSNIYFSQKTAFRGGCGFLQSPRQHNIALFHALI